MERPVDMDSDEDDPGEDSGWRLLGFMFGNVDASGNIDADYLDEDAREHLAVLVDQLRPSLADLDLAESPSAAAGRDHGGAEEALVDHGEDDEGRSGAPEAEAAMAEAGNPSSDQELFLSDFSMNHSAPIGYFLEDEDYDAEDGRAIETQAAGDDPPSESRDRGELCHAGDLPPVGTLGDDAHLSSDAEVFEGEPAAAEESAEPRKGTDLPVLCVENGMEILRFSEIFGVREPLKRVGRREPYRNMRSKVNIETTGVVDAMETDEESFLKSTCHGPVVAWRHLSPVLGDCVKVGGGDVESLVGEHGRHSCLVGQPMKERVARHMSPRWWEPDSSIFYPLDQQDWEDKIIWGSSPTPSHGSSRSCVMSENDSDTFVADAEVGEMVSSKDLGQLSQIEPDEDHCLVSLSIPGEPSISRRVPQPAGSPSSLGLRDSQPQPPSLDACLRHSDLDASNVKPIVRRQGVIRDAAARCLKKLPLNNKDLLDGCWLGQIIWDPRDPIPKTKLVLDLQDEQMPFETLEQNPIGQPCPCAGAAIPYYPLQTPLEGLSGHSSLQGLPTDEFNISNDEFYSDCITGGQSKSLAKRRANYFTKAIHSAPALKLQTMKPKLSNKEIANFHRPKALWYPRENKFASRIQGALCTKGSINIVLKILGGKRFRLHLDVKETLSSIKSRLVKKLDFKSAEKVKIFYSGKELEDDQSLAIQGVKPSSLLHVVRSKIHLWPATQLLRGGNESLCPPGAFRRKSDLSLRDGSVFLMEYCEERPLLLGNIGMVARLCTYRRKSELDDVTALPPESQHDVLGNILTLEPPDESPFLGGLGPGCSQPSLETNMYRAPLFPHKLLTTDYLLVRSANGMLALRRINRMCVVGQQEPHMAVISPGVKGVRNYNSKRLLVHAYREFYVKLKSGLHPYIRADELSLQFPSLTETFLRKRLKHCADFQRGLNGHAFWVKKPDFQIPSEVEIRRILAPEDVCCYESMQAGLYLLKHLGICRLTHPVYLSPKLSQLPWEAPTRAAASHIERELSITPWSLSSSFVSCVNQGLENIHSLEITGAGDPSGCGLGFSYICATWPTPRLPLLSTRRGKRAPAVRVGSTSARADTDFHGSSIGTAFDSISKSGFHDNQIREVARCDQNAMVYQLLSKQPASKFKTDTVTLSNSQRKSYLLLCQQARRKCQEIWDRQAQSLSSADGNEYESSPKGGSDLHPFVVDLDNLLDVEEFAEGKDSPEDRNEVSGVNEGQQMGNHLFQVQGEEENEDDQAEAALIGRWLDGDNDIRIMKVGKLKHVIKGSSRSLSSKDILLQNNDLQSIPADKSLCLNLKAAYESDNVHAGLVKRQNKAMEDEQGIMDRKELIDRPERQIFACGACGRMGHMKTNKNCPKYREELGASESENVSAKSNPIEVGMELPFQTPNNKFMRVELSERSDKSGIDVHGGLHLKFKYFLTDEHHQSNVAGPHHSEKLLTLKQETDTKSVTKLYVATTTSCNKKSEDKHKKLQKSPLALRLPTHHKISFKPPKDVNNVQQGTQAAGMEQDNESTDARATSKLASPREDKQPSERSPKEMEVRKTGKTVEQRKILGENNRYEKIAEEPLWRTPGRTSLRIDGHREAERVDARKGKEKKLKSVSSSSYAKEYKTSREARRMHDRDQVAKGQPTDDLGCQVALPMKHRRGGEVLLSNILENIVKGLREHDEVSYLFVKPVSKREAPDYLDIIKHPMDLSTIKEKVRRMEYKSREDFRRDVWQINFNAHRYNDGRSPGVGLLADQLLLICDHLLSQNGAILTEAEARIEL